MTSDGNRRGRTAAARQKGLAACLIGCGSAALMLLLWYVGALDPFEYATFTWRTRCMASPAKADRRIKLILLDQRSLDWGEREMGWQYNQWYRSIYAALVDFCRRAEPRAVVFDLLFDTQSFAGAFDDDELSLAISNCPGFVAGVILGRQAGRCTNWPVSVAEPVLRLAHDAQAAVDIHNWTHGSFPIDRLAEHMTMVGHVNAQQDPDGIIRRVRLIERFDGRCVPSLGLAAWLAGKIRTNNATPEAVSNSQVNSRELGLNGKRIPIDSRGRVLLRYRTTYLDQAYSAAAIIQSELRLRQGDKPLVDPATFKDAYILFGYSAPALKDLRPTPLMADAPGVTIHTTVLDNLLNDDFMRLPPAWATMLCALSLAVTAGLAILFAPKQQMVLLGFALFALLPWLLGFAGYALGWWQPIILHEGAVGLAMLGGVLYNYATEGRQKARIKNIFRHYLSPAVIERLLDDPERLRLGGEKRPLSIFFSDLEKFSTISEMLDPEALTALLNAYLSDMTDIILEEGGTLDKYEGDAIIAFWNAPLDQPDHALRACRTMIRCQRKLTERQDFFMARTQQPLRMRIGVNTGEVVVGNMGSNKRFDYTILGDAANLAARLEGANKMFGSYAMISENTWSQVHDQIYCRELGRIKVVGRHKPVRVFEPVCFAGESHEEKLDLFVQALYFVYEQRYQQALELFTSIADDPPAQVYIGYCRQMLAPDAEAWDGIVNLTQK